MAPPKFNFWLLFDKDFEWQKSVVALVRFFTLEVHENKTFTSIPVAGKGIILHWVAGCGTDRHRVELTILDLHHFLRLYNNATNTNYTALQIRGQVSTQAMNEGAVVRNEGYISDGEDAYWLHISGDRTRSVMKQCKQATYLSASRRFFLSQFSQYHSCIMYKKLLKAFCKTNLQKLKQSEKNNNNITVKEEMN